MEKTITITQALFDRMRDTIVACGVPHNPNAIECANLADAARAPSRATEQAELIEAAVAADLEAKREDLGVTVIGSSSPPVFVWDEA